MTAILENAQQKLRKSHDFVMPYLLTPAYQKAARAVFSRQGAAAGIALFAAGLLIRHDDRKIATLQAWLAAGNSHLNAAWKEINTGSLLVKLLNDQLAQAEDRLKLAQRHASETARFEKLLNAESERTDSLQKMLAQSIAGNATGDCPANAGEGFAIVCRNDLEARGERRALGPDLMMKYFAQEKLPNDFPKGGIQALAEQQIRVRVLTTGDTIKLTGQPQNAQPVAILYDGNARELIVSTGAFVGDDKTLIACADGKNAGSEQCSIGSFDIVPTMAYAIKTVLHSGERNGVFAFEPGNDEKKPALIFDNSAPIKPAQKFEGHNPSLQQG